MERKTIWDPLRKRDVARTPEEEVRQWFIGVMQSRMHIPAHMMMSEVGMKFGDGVVKKEYRADILVYDRQLKPLMAVECKRPETALDREVLEQILIYDMVLDVRYLVVTNGLETHVFEKNADGYKEMSTLPQWQAMVEILR